MDAELKRRALNLSFNIARKMGMQVGDDIRDLVSLCELAVLTEKFLGIEHRAYVEVRDESGNAQPYAPGPVRPLEDAWKLAKDVIENNPSPSPSIAPAVC